MTRRSELSKEEKIDIINEIIDIILTESKNGHITAICVNYEFILYKKGFPKLYNIFPELKNKLYEVAKEKEINWKMSLLWQPYDYENRIDFLNELKKELNSKSH